MERQYYSELEPKYEVDNAGNDFYGVEFEGHALKGPAVTPDAISLDHLEVAQTQDVESQRGRGYGKFLMSAFALRAIEDGVDTIEMEITNPRVHDMTVKMFGSEHVDYVDRDDITVELPMDVEQAKRTTEYVNHASGATSEDDMAGAEHMFKTRVHLDQLNDQEYQKLVDTYTGADHQVAPDQDEPAA